MKIIMYFVFGAFALLVAGGIVTITPGNIAHLGRLPAALFIVFLIFLVALVGGAIRRL